MPDIKCRNTECVFNNSILCMKNRVIIGKFLKCLDYRKRGGCLDVED